MTDYHSHAITDHMLRLDAQQASDDAIARAEAEIADAIMVGDAINAGRYRLDRDSWVDHVINQRDFNEQLYAALAGNAGNLISFKRYLMQSLDKFAETFAADRAAHVKEHP